MSGLLLQKFPEATIVLMDFSERMLDVARQRFAGQPGVEYRVGDYQERGPRGAVPTSSSRRSQSTTWSPGRSRGCSSGSTRRSCREGSSSTPTRRTARRRTSPAVTSVLERVPRVRPADAPRARGGPGTPGPSRQKRPGLDPVPVAPRGRFSRRRPGVQEPDLHRHRGEEIGRGPSPLPGRRSWRCRTTPSSRTRRAVLERYGEPGGRKQRRSAEGVSAKGRHRHSVHHPDPVSSSLVHSGPDSSPCCSRVVKKRLHKEYFP